MDRHVLPRTYKYMHPENNISTYESLFRKPHTSTVSVDLSIEVLTPKSRIFKYDIKFSICKHFSKLLTYLKSHL